MLKKYIITLIINILSFSYLDLWHVTAMEKYYYNNPTHIVPASYKLKDVPLLNQLSPDFFPMGCECVSVTMALNFKNINVQSQEVINSVTIDTDPRKGFIGSMYSMKYYQGTVPVIWPEALIYTVQKYRKNSYIATGYSQRDIENAVAKGNPVLVWYSWEPVNIAILTGTDVVYSSKGVHAVLVVGYDNENWYINDPTKGYRKLNKETFYKKYVAYGSRAIVIV